MTQQEAFERNLSRGNDTVSLRGKFITTVASVTTTPAALFAVWPSSLGARAAGLSPFFTRYRMKYLKVKFLANNPVSATVPGVAALGFVDDVSSVDVPTSVGGVSELRCSGTNFFAETIPTFFEWAPVDKARWYYTTSDSSDTRFQFPANLWVAGSAACSVAIEIDYSLVYAGAADVAST
jgi:hypothetical protein